MPTNPPRDASFIVRIWWEERSAAPPFWRGQAVHAPSGVSRYFDHLPGLLAFIEEWTGATGPPQADPAALPQPSPEGQKGGPR